MKMVASAGSLVIRFAMLASGSVKSTTKLIVNCSVPSTSLSSVTSTVKHLSPGFAGGISSIARSTFSWKSLAVARKEETPKTANSSTPNGEQKKKDNYSSILLSKGNVFN